ncbi:substrate-binding domain-containing protein [Streptomyces sp. NPDC002773]|uniref:substrate-binding domain-containing protein n=1 Tax=Streptomyces sp. NPDC002773 TaxID=3154430 RepID=UPI0033321ED2
MDEMSAALKANGEATGRVVVGSTALLMEYEMGELVRECRYRYPGVQVSPKVMTATRVESAVAAGEVDIGLTLTVDPDDEVPRAPGVSRQTLFKVPLVPIGGTSPVSGAAEEIDRVLVVDPDCVSQEVLLRHLTAEHGISPSVLEAGSTRSAISLARAGLGVAMVPRVAVEHDLGRDCLAVAEDLPCTNAYVQALWAGATWLPPAVSAFLELVRKAPGVAARQAVHV